MAERPTELDWAARGLVAADAPALTNVLKSEAVAQVERALPVQQQAWRRGLPLPSWLRLRAAACRGSRRWSSTSNQIGDAGMQALASAFASAVEGLFLVSNSWSSSTSPRQQHLYQNTIATKA